jgi:tRNA pseudouridine55 synthase
VNRATRLADLLGRGEKSYTAMLKLGSATDTYDRDGVVMSEGDVSSIQEADVVRAFRPFLGAIKQTPPMYSSVKRNGTPLYKLARRGVTVERQAKDVTIFSMDVEAVQMPFVRFRVVCSKGTYIRSICHEVGTILGCGAHLYSLVRTSSGAFSIENAISPTEAASALLGAMIPMEDAVRMSEGLLGQATPMRGASAKCLHTDFNRC